MPHLGGSKEHGGGETTAACVAVPHHANGDNEPRPFQAWCPWMGSLNHRPLPCLRVTAEQTFSRTERPRQMKKRSRQAGRFASLSVNLVIPVLTRRPAGGAPAAGAAGAHEPGPASRKKRQRRVRHPSSLRNPRSRSARNSAESDPSPMRASRSQRHHLDCITAAHLGGSD